MDIVIWFKVFKDKNPAKSYTWATVEMTLHRAPSRNTRVFLSARLSLVRRTAVLMRTSVGVKFCWAKSFLTNTWLSGKIGGGVCEQWEVGSKMICTKKKDRKVVAAIVRYQYLYSSPEVCNMIGSRGRRDLASGGGLIVWYTWKKRVREQDCR